MPAAGRLRHRVTLQSKTVAQQNSYGEEVITWTDEATVWAAIEPLSGREFYEAQRAGAEVTTRIRIRHYDGVMPEWRAVEGNHIYDILSVANVEERDREMHLMCREVL